MRDLSQTPWHAGECSHIQPHSAHQRQRVAALDDSRPHLVVEYHRAGFDAIFEMHVRGGGAERRRQLGQREVVGGDQTDGAAADQRPYNRFGSNPPVVRVGAVEDLVEQKQDRRLAAGQIDD